MSKITCQNCGAENSSRLKYCSQCSQELNKVVQQKAATKSSSGSSGLTFKKVYPFLLGIVVLLAAFFTTQRFLSASLNKALVVAASELKENCPMMVDNETRLDNAVALPDNTFQYNYTLVSLAKEYIQMELEAIKNELLPGIVNNVKTNPDLVFFRENKTNISYNYRDRNGVFLLEIEVTPDMYQ